MSDIIVVNLPSFLRKALKAYALKSLIREHKVELYRIGRSRNWQMKATPEQLLDITSAIEESNEASWQWLVKHLRNQRQNFTHEALVSIAKKNSGITVNELVAKTDCTVAEARIVIDELEWLD